MKEMAAMYGYDISMPAKNTREAIQWTYFAYLASIKEQNGAAMSLGRTSTFFDIYVERDMQRGILTEEQAQELIDDFVMKLRSARHLRTPEYNELFGGDPMWITESVGGVNNSGVPLVTKGSYRMLNTLITSVLHPSLTLLYCGLKDFPNLSRSSVQSCLLTQIRYSTRMMTLCVWNTAMITLSPAAYRL